ncbi:MAG: penicillin acylase family protein [Gemmataceae bacterium]|nr:penicillin acylase family protein [Gemmataceae bacterium]
MRRALAVILLIALPCPAPAQTAAELRAKAKAVLAQLDGQIAVAGVKEPVEVKRDRWGVAHIHAQNADDLFFAQGWVAAQDRLFQIDLWRRVGTGETAEIIGPEAIEADRFARLIRFRGDMKAEWTSYGADTQRIATAFTRGINAYIDHLGDKLPIEFQVLGYRPKKWQPEDVLTRMSGIIMSRNFSQEIARARLVAAVGADKARQLAPTDPPVAYAPAPGLDLKDITKDILAGYQAATKALQFTPPPSASNNWAVDGSLSASGKPMLASDPHRTIAMPALRYIVHLQAPGWNVIGAGEPGLPGIALGHNERIAWGITIVGTDQADIFVEKTRPGDATQYRDGDQWVPMTIIREKISVKGKAEPVEVELRFTRHGPVIHRDDRKQLAFALKWAGSDPGGAAYLGGLALGRAGTRAEFLKALEHWKIPSLNFMYADVDGNIGWVAGGAIPVRKPGHHGLLPVPGWSGDHDWQGCLPVKDMPQSFNPPRHWLATANHNILPKGYPHQIAYEWAPPHRFLRIEQRLNEKKMFTLEDFQSIQHENTSLPGRQLIGLLKVARSNPDLFGAGILKRHSKALDAWDGSLKADSSVAVLYAMALQKLSQAFYQRKDLDKETADVLKSLNNISVMLAALENPTELWFGDQPKNQRDLLVIDSFATAVRRAQQLLGDDSTWRWGKLHTAAFHHALERLGPEYAKAFNLGPVERPGDVNTPNNTRHNEKFEQVHGASYRQLFDLADWDKGLATSTPGQSGQLGSPHYDDLLPMWAEARYFPLAFSRQKVDEVTAHRLTLTPR